MKGLILRVMTQILRLSENKARAGWLMIPLFIGLAVVFLYAVEPATAVTMSGVDITSGLSFFEFAGLNLAQFLVMVAQIIGHLMVAVIDVIGLPIMQYNGFGGSKIVQFGWGLVRDIMNIGFVAGAFLLALKTMFFGPKFEWQKNLILMLLFAILINFSLTFCGIMIDIAQVVMLTFVNAVKDIAGGNLIQLFGLTHILNFDSDSIQALIDSDQGLQTFNFLGSAIAAVILMSIAFLTILTMMALLVYRIVILWILMILSPIAFLFGGIQNMIGGKIKPYADWWAQFTAADVIGPILMFFFWLALSVAGSGNIAAVEAFAVYATSLPEEGAFVMSDIPLAIFRMDRLVSFVLGIGIFAAAFDVAMRVSSDLPGSMKKLIGPGVAAGVAKRAALASTKIGKSGAKAGWGGFKATTAAGVGGALALGRKGTGLAKKGVGDAGKGVGEAWDVAKANIEVPIGVDKEGKQKKASLGELKGKIGGKIADFGAGVAKDYGVAGSIAGGAIADKGLAMKGEERAKQSKNITEAQKKVRNYGTDHLQRLADKKVFTGEKDKAESQAALLELTTKGWHRKEQKTSTLRKNYKRLKELGVEDAIVGTGAQGELAEAKQKRVDMILPGKDNTAQENKDAEKEVKTILSKTGGRKFVRDIEEETFADPTAREFLGKEKTFISGLGKDQGDMTVLDAVDKVGLRGQKEALASKRGEQAGGGEEVPAGATPEAQARAAVAEVGQKQEDLDQRRKEAKTDEDKKAVSDAQVSLQVEHRGTIQAVLGDHSDLPEKVGAGDLKADGGALARGIALEGTASQLEFVGQDEGKKEAFLEENSEAKMKERNYSPGDKARTRAASMVVSGEVKLGPAGEQKATMGALMKRHPEHVGKMFDAKKSQAEEQALDHAVATNITVGDVEGIMAKASGTSDSQIKAQLEKTLDSLRTSLNHSKQTNAIMSAEARKAASYLKARSKKA